MEGGRGGAGVIGYHWRSSEGARSSSGPIVVAWMEKMTRKKEKETGAWWLRVSLWDVTQQPPHPRKKCEKKESVDERGIRGQGSTT